MKTVLTVGGSESAGVAGVAVDLRAFAALGVHGAVALSAVTAQPDGGLQLIQAPLLRAQIRAAGEVDAVKVGMLLGVEQAETIVEAVSPHDISLVFDPVRGPSRGAAFVSADAWCEAVRVLLPHTTLLTPNLPELEELVGRTVGDRDGELIEAAQSLRDRGAEAVLVKGGHRSQDPDDLLVTGEGALTLAGERIAGEFRGTGCLLASAIAALLARGRDLESAVREAKSFLEQALRDAGSERPHVLFEYYGSEGLP